MKKFISIVLCVMIMMSVTGVSAFAATSSVSGIVKPNRVRIEASQKWVRVNRSIILNEVVYPGSYAYDSVEWYSLDYDLISVTDYGEVTGLKPGIAHIEVFVYVEGPTRKVEVGSAEIEIEVKGAITSSFLSDDSEFDPSVPRATLEEKNNAKKGTITAKTVKEAVKKSLAKGTTTDTTFKNYTTISTVSLESAAADMQLGGGVVLLNFDTIAVDGKTVEGRLTLNPRGYKRVKYSDPMQVGHNINIRVNTSGDDVMKTKEKFQKYYKNDMMVIKAGQKGRYGMSVTCTVKANSALSKAKQSNLYLYAYDPDKGNSGTFNLVKNANITVDKNKNINFTTDTGNYLIITNGKLDKK